MRDGEDIPLTFSEFEILLKLMKSPRRVFTREELEFIAGLCREHDVLAFTDEIYEHILYDGTVHVPIMNIPGMRHRTVIVNSLKGLFVPQEAIGEQYRKGLMGRDSAGMNWKLDQNVNAQTFGSFAGTATADTTSSNTGILTSGWASSSTITITKTGTVTPNVGDTFTIDGVYAVNPQNRQAYGSNKLRNFVIKSISGSTVVVSPAIISGGQFQNVSIPTTSATAAINFYNKAGAVSPQNIIMHRNAFTLAVADLELPEGVHFAGRASDKEIGLSMRVVRQYTINNDSIPTRLDVLYGWAPLYPELACRVAS